MASEQKRGWGYSGWIGITYNGFPVSLTAVLLAAAVVFTLVALRAL